MNEKKLKTVKFGLSLLSMALLPACGAIDRFFGLDVDNDNIASSPTPSPTPTATAAPGTPIPPVFVSSKTPLGWTDGSSNTLAFQFEAASSSQSGAIFECRSGPITSLDTKPFVPCDGSSGVNPTHTPSKDGTIPEGTYRIDARMSLNGQTSAVSSHTFYVHESLNAANTCTAVDTDENYFAKAATVLSTSHTFGAATSLANPFINIQFNSGTQTEVLSLRRAFVKNAANNLIVIRRNFQSRTHPNVESLGDGFPNLSPRTTPDCLNHFSLGFGPTRDILDDSSNTGLISKLLSGDSGNFTPYPTTVLREKRRNHCDAMVINADGQGACIAQESGGLVVKKLLKDFTRGVTVISPGVGHRGRFAWSAKQRAGDTLCAGFRYSHYPHACLSLPD